jgi:hypothetical protein
MVKISSITSFFLTKYKMILYLIDSSLAGASHPNFSSS